MIKRRNMAMQVLLMIVTLGIYGIYWFYVTSKEMVEYKHLNGSPALWTLLSLIPLANLYAEYKQGEAVEALTDSASTGGSFSSYGSSSPLLSGLLFRRS